MRSSTAPPRETGVLGDGWDFVDVFPPITLFNDGKCFRLVDGFHRLAASRLLGRATISALIYRGTLDDALWFALGANRTNGLRLSAHDVKRAIRRAVLHWPDRSSRVLADQLGCSDRCVRAVKEQAGQQVGTTAHVTDVTGRDGKRYPSSRSMAAPPGHDGCHRARCRRPPSGTRAVHR